MGARISAHRKNKGLTQEALANTLGVSNQAVSKWESDVCCPDIALLPQLVDALEMTLDELIATIHSHPTVTETIREAALSAEKRAIHVPNK